jgi:ABC-type multidrug transport system permease subunit
MSGGAIVSATLTRATARRVLAQLRHDPRTVAMLLAVPSVLMILLRYVLNNPLALDRFAPAYIGVFPFVSMFIVTAITTQRERARGTLERLMAMPLGKLDLLAGYAIAFGLVACAQVTAVLRWLSDVLPLSYAVDAMQRISTSASWTAAIGADVAVILAFTAAALAGGALTLRRQTR